jgi:hypothetical protein
MERSYVMKTRIALAATVIAAATSIAGAQSSMPAPKPSAPTPMTSAPASDTTGAQPYQPPPAARSGEKGLPVGEGAVNGLPVEVKRVK